MRSDGIGNEAALLALRDGTLSFEAFARRAEVREAALERARYFLRRWPHQDLHTEEDLSQDALLATWRGVDAWDPERRTRKGEPVSIKRFVEYQVGKALERKVRSASKFRKGSGAAAGRRVVLGADVVDILGGSLGDGAGSRFFDRIASENATSVAEDGVDAERRVASLTSVLEREAALAVLRGVGLDAYAERVYDDVGRRLALRLDSRAHARRLVQSVARSATLRLAANG